jgi:hypothetical protein
MIKIDKKIVAYEVVDTSVAQQDTKPAMAEAIEEKGVVKEGMEAKE